MNWHDWYEQFLAKCAKQGVYPERFVVAFSGGLDSTVLLDLLKHLSNKPILAVHVNHQLQAEASQWAVQCQQHCDQLQIPYACEKVEIPRQQGHSLEAIARKKRYEALAKYIHDPNTLLLTAHHQTDQAETILLQLCRGAGPKGLSGMPWIKSFSNGFLARSLLTIPHQRLIDYAHDRHLTWIEDPSNANLHFDRNFIRHDLLPQLQIRWPGVIATLSRSAEHCATAEKLQSDLAKYDQGQLVCLNQLPLARLTSLTFLRQANLLRHWLFDLDWPIPSTAQLQELIDSVCFAKPDAAPILSLLPNRYQLRRYRNTLYAFDIPPWEGDPAWMVDWDLQQPLSLPLGLGTITAIRTESRSQGLSLPEDITTLRVCFYQSGERFWPDNRQGTHPVKKLCQEWQLAPWERKQLIFLYDQDHLIGIWHSVTDRYYACHEPLFAGQILTNHWILSYQSGETHPDPH